MPNKYDPEKDKCVNCTLLEIFKGVKICINQKSKYYQAEMMFEDDTCPDHKKKP